MGAADEEDSGDDGPAGGQNGPTRRRVKGVGETVGMAAATRMTTRTDDGERKADLRFWSDMQTRSCHRGAPGAELRSVR